MSFSCGEGGEPLRRWGGDHPGNGLWGRPTALGQWDGEVPKMGEQERISLSVGYSKGGRLSPLGHLTHLGVPQDLSHQTLISHLSHPRHHQPWGQHDAGSPGEALKGYTEPPASDCTV